MGAILNPKSLLSDTMKALPIAAVATGGVFSGWIFAKSVLNRGGANKDEGILGYSMNAAGGLLYAVAIGLVLRKRDWFQAAVVGAIMSPLLRVGVAALTGKKLPFGIITGFEDYVMVEPGMSDFLTLNKFRQAGMRDWLTVPQANRLAHFSGLIQGDTIKRYGDE